MHALNDVNDDVNDDYDNEQRIKLNEEIIKDNKEITNFLFVFYNVNEDDNDDNNFDKFELKTLIKLRKKEMYNKIKILHELDIKIKEKEETINWKENKKKFWLALEEIIKEKEEIIKEKEETIKRKEEIIKWKEEIIREKNIKKILHE